jgi:hypothetical protein
MTGLPTPFYQPFSSCTFAHTGAMSTAQSTNVLVDHIASMLMLVFWVAMPCVVKCAVRFHRFRGTYYLYLQGWRWRWYVPLKHWYLSTNLHGVPTQKTNTTSSPLWEPLISYTAFIFNIEVYTSSEMMTIYADNWFYVNIYMEENDNRSQSKL